MGIACVLALYAALAIYNSRFHTRTYTERVLSPSGRFVAAKARDVWRSGADLSVAVSRADDAEESQWIVLFDWNAFRLHELIWEGDTRLRVRGHVYDPEGVARQQWVPTLGIQVQVEPIE